MQLSVITDEIDNDLDHALDVMAEYGVRKAELRTIWDKNIADAPDEYIDRVQTALKKRGVTVAAIASPFYKCDLTDDSAEGPAGPLHDATARGLAAQIDLLNRCIEIASRLDTRMIRVFTFWKRGPLTPAIEERIVDAFSEPVQIAERAGVTLVIENEHACYIGTGAETARVLTKIGSPNVKAVWDPGNAFCAGEVPYPMGYDAILPFIEHVHAKDARRTGPDKEEWCVIGEGEIDWAGQIRALKKAGYSGLVSLETHYGKPTKEAASRACLAALKKLVEED
ncbi:MAG TPA: sugar phosphate isomerase/epimerase [Capsulimonadaceae bacterium]|nr:sugar phosphate isomerase/epimerase [Capsulimonadaceae bacterium]